MTGLQSVLHVRTVRRRSANPVASKPSLHVVASFLFR